ncbi:MAG: hypothetical protein BMS9Abin28_1095 [Anaerolineae bacterium]|nr:MAG: hypothetical protein BMS9Abin28_1095 [Anaerolineae bacterium]
MLTGDDSHLTSLLVAEAASLEHELALHYAPFIKFDQREPFLPLIAGYSVFRQSGLSPSFPRMIEAGPGEQVVEYAIWWDWDIRSLRISSERLVPWPMLFRWIPERVSYLAEGLEELARPDPAPFEPLECEKVP